MRPELLLLQWEDLGTRRCGRQTLTQRPPSPPPGVHTCTAGLFPVGLDLCLLTRRIRQRRHDRVSVITFQECAAAVLLSLKKQAAMLASCPSWRVRVARAGRRPGRSWSSWSRSQQGAECCPGHVSWKLILPQLVPQMSRSPGQHLDCSCAQHPEP